MTDEIIQTENFQKQVHKKYVLKKRSDIQKNYKVQYDKDLNPAQ